ncbi:MAG TPA: deoxyribodipyrimidine photolyase [Polyangiaceae bacterium]
MSTLLENLGALGTRVTPCNAKPLAKDADFVLYWMIAHRRTHYNFALDRAVGWARALNKPLLVFEPLRVGYPWASDRLHAFVLAGMRDHQAHFEDRRVLYYPYVEPSAGAGKGLLAELAKRACLIVTDEFPCFFLPRMVAAAARNVPCRMEQVDSNGLLPLRATTRTFLTAHSFRAFLQKVLPEHAAHQPRKDPSADPRLSTRSLLPREIRRRWPPASPALLAVEPRALARLPIDHSVGVAELPGGDGAGRARLRLFVRSKLTDYAGARRLPEQDGSSKLSPYLHFGHVSVHEIFLQVKRAEGFGLDQLSPRRGAREGYWPSSASAAAFLDELVTWREIGFNMCHTRSDYHAYASLPGWAKATLANHADDPRPHRYSLAALEAGRTHDPIWNAAQMQMVREGWFHNQLRMLWGKKILEWSASPKAALKAMVHLMGKYSLDGRNPNSWTGFFWVLGRYDRPWGPERPIFGKVRYMTSQSMARKVPLENYVARYTESP